MGQDIVRYLPFENLSTFVNNVAVEGMPWTTNGSGAFFLAWALAIWVAGVVVLQRRDA